MVPEFSSWTGAAYELLCPHCKGNYLHHGDIDIFECGEDAKSGLHVLVTDGKATVDTSLQGNPSSRRHGLKINFWCETCHATPILTIAQHKGNTEVDFKDGGKAEQAPPPRGATPTPTPKPTDRTQVQPGASATIHGLTPTQNTQTTPPLTPNLGKT
jgi:hypothetical protein